MADEFWPHAFAYVLLNEGQTYVEDPSPTLRGITLETLEAWRKKMCVAADVKALTLSETQQIYKAFYWDKLRCGELVNEAAATALMDAAVNTGLVQATKALQSVLCGMVDRTLHVEIDGVLGSKTLAAANVVAPDVLVQGISWQQQRYYVQLVRAKPVRKTYLNTWLKRAALYQALLT